MIRNWIGGKASWEDDKAVLNFFESEGVTIDEKLGQVCARTATSESPGLVEGRPRQVAPLLIETPDKASYTLYSTLRRT